MKLYYSPGACSLATHIALCETGQTIGLEKVDLRAKKCADGSDYLAVNPKGAVPALRLDDGSVLTEGPAVLQYVADRRPEAGIVPPAGSLDRYRVLEALNWVGSELHKAFSVQFAPNVPQEWRNATITTIERHLDRVNGWLTAREWIAGNRFSIADAYLFVVIGWAPHVKIDLARWPAITAYQARIAARPAVQQAMREEGLLG